MSHVVAVKTEVKDLEAVKRACAELGLEFKENQKAIRWYGRWMNDYDAQNAAYRIGIKPEQYGTCEHAISLPGCNYDIGLLKNPETGGYKIYFDFFGEGHKLQQKIGNGGETLLQLYGMHKATLEAKKRGHLVTRSVVPGTKKIKLTVTGM